MHMFDLKSSLLWRFHNYSDIKTQIEKNDISKVQSHSAKACHPPQGTQPLGKIPLFNRQGQQLTIITFPFNVLISMLCFSDIESNSHDNPNLSNSSLPLLPNKGKCITLYCFDLLQ